MTQERVNDLVRYRKRMRFTQIEVTRLLGWKNTKGLTKIESGGVIPTLTTAFKLSIIYRVPIEFLFSSVYESLRNHIRAKEMSLIPAGQRVLPLNFSAVHDS